MASSITQTQILKTIETTVLLKRLITDQIILHSLMEDLLEERFSVAPEHRDCSPHLPNTLYIESLFHSSPIRDHHVV